MKAFHSNRFLHTNFLVTWKQKGMQQHKRLWKSSKNPLQWIHWIKDTSDNLDFSLVCIAFHFSPLCLKSIFQCILLLFETYYVIFLKTENIQADELQNLELNNCYLAFFSPAWDSEEWGNYRRWWPFIKSVACWREIRYLHWNGGGREV